MKRYGKKLIAMLSLSLLVTSIPYRANAETKPEYKTERSSLYENAKANGVYTYTVKNVKKGQKVKWVLTGPGKKYASLKYTTSTVKGKTISNKITIDTDKKEDASNALLALTAKVYSAEGSLITKVKDRVRIKVKATDISITTKKITDDLTSLKVGQTYDFDAEISPANSTNKVYWQVMNVTGKDYSDDITSSGVWTPTQDGKYTIKAMAKNSKSGKVIVYHTASATVGLSLRTVKQTAANEFYATFSEDAEDIVKPENFYISASNGTKKLSVKNIRFSDSGNTAYITTDSCFSNKTSYTITYGSNARTFIASVGEVKKAVILTETVEAGKETPIEYALYDENNIDVKAAAEGVTTFSAEVTNGYKTEEDSLYMHTVGKTARVKLTYIKEDSSKEIATTKIIRCVEATVTEALVTNFTLTLDKEKPAYDAADYKEVTSTAIGETAYLHFRALDKNQKEIPYDSVQFISSNDNALIIDSDGRLTPIKTGTVTVTILAKEGGKEVTYSKAVTILEKKAPTTVALSTNSIVISNYYVTDYREYIDVLIKDQYGKTVPFSDAVCTIKENSGKTVNAFYDKENKQIAVKGAGVMAGTYYYTATFVVDGVTLSASFSVVVQSIPTSGSMGYQIQADHPKFDMIVDEMTMGNKTITIHLNRYIGGVFAGYTSISSATVQKDGLYYGNDLTVAGTKTVQNVTSTNGNIITLTPVKITRSNSDAGECRKAEQGNYTITVKYLDSSATLREENLNINLTDSQENPIISIKSGVSSKICSNALALVTDCVNLSDNSVIYDCAVTGYNSEGSLVAINPGQKIHIDTISIKQLLNLGGTGNQKVYVYYTINLDKTMTNKK